MLTFVASFRVAGQSLKAWLRARVAKRGPHPTWVQETAGPKGNPQLYLHPTHPAHPRYASSERVFVVTLTAGELQDVLFGAGADWLNNVCGSWSPDEVPDTAHGHAVALDFQKRLAAASPHTVVLVHTGMTPQVRALERIVGGVMGHGSGCDVRVVSAADLAQAQDLSVVQPDTELAC